MAVSRKEIEEGIAAKIIALLDDGCVPWKKGWTSQGILPANFYTKRPYRGINSLILGMEAMAHGYSSPYWTTARAAITNHKAYPMKGTTASYAILWKPTVKRDEATGEDKRFFLMRSYAVFNLDQIDGIEAPVIDRGEPIEVPSALATLRESYENPPKLRHVEGDRAYYAPMHDEITLPKVEQFNSVEAYAETWAHEHIHSTGHESRLNRLERTWVEREDYAFEELVAEIGAAMLMQGVGVSIDLPVMAGYIDNWRKAISDDPSIVVSAAQKAQRACDVIHNAVPEAVQQEVAA